MGRIRTIKPEFFKHETLFDAEAETALPLRLAFAGLWTACDREGRFEWRPRALKSDILPYDDIDFSRVLDALMTRGFIQKYSVGGVDFGYVPSFSRHQVINNRERESEIPDPPQDIETSKLSTREPRVNDASSTREGKYQAEREGEREGDSSSSGSAREPAHDPPPDQAPITNVPDEAWALWRAVLKAAGVPEERLPTYWMPPAAVIHVQRWMGMGLTEQEIIDTARMTRANHTDPPNGPKALDHAMQRTAAAKIMPAFTPPDAQPLRMIGGSNGQRPGAAEKQEKLARIIRAAARGTT